MDRAPVDRRGVDLGVVVPVLEDLEAGGLQCVGVSPQHRRYSSPEIDCGTVQNGLVWKPRIDDWISGVGSLGVPTITTGLWNTGLPSSTNIIRIVAGIDQHVAAAEVGRQPAPPLEVGDDLHDSGRRSWC